MTRLCAGDIDFMLDVLDLTDELRAKLERTQEGQCQLSLEEADKLRDLCGERLQTHGFGPGYELTEEGEKLEALIDRLYAG